MKPKEEDDLIHCQSCNEPQNYDFEFIFWDLSSSRVNCLTAKSENHVTSAVLNEKVSPCCSSAEMSPSTLFRRRFFQTFVRNKNRPSTLFKWFCTLRKFLISKIYILKEIGCALTLSAATQTTYSSLWVRWYDLKQCWVAREPRTQFSHCDFTYFWFQVMNGGTMMSLFKVQDAICKDYKAGKMKPKFSQFFI